NFFKIKERAVGPVYIAHSHEECIRVYGIEDALVPPLPAIVEFLRSFNNVQLASRFLTIALPDIHIAGKLFAGKHHCIASAEIDHLCDGRHAVGNGRATESDPPAPIRSEKSVRSLLLSLKKSSGAIFQGCLLAQMPPIPASSTDFSMGDIYAQII